MSRRRTAVLLAPLTALALAACTGGAASDNGAPGSPSAVPESVASHATPTSPAPTYPPVNLPASPRNASPAAPDRLKGTWTVEATDEEPQVLLTFENRRFELVRLCGTVTGSWRANAAGLFAGEVADAAGGCARTMPAWLGDAMSAVVGDGFGRLLLDRSGQVLAVLSPAGPATEPPLEAEPFFEVTPDERHASRSAVPLPRGLAPATPKDLAGSWEQTEDAVPNSEGNDWYATFEADGGWTSYDGCNGGGGSWWLGTGGALATSMGPTTLKLCSRTSAVTQNVDRTARAGFSGSLLVLYSQDGERLSTLRRR